MKFIVDVPHTDQPADTDVEKSTELWRSTIEQGCQRTWGNDVTVSVATEETPRFEVWATFSEWITESVFYGSNLDGLGVSLAVAQIMNDLRRWVEEGQSRILTGIRVERVN